MTKERIDLFEIEDRKFTNLEKESDKLWKKKNENMSGLGKWFWAEHIELIVL